MTDQEFHEQFEAARKRHIDAMNAMAEAVERQAAAIRETEERAKNKPRYEYQRQPGDPKEGYQPKCPGPDWELSNFTEGENFVVYLWRRPVAS